MVLEIVAAVGGSIAFAKYLGPILYHECFAPTSDDDLLLNAGLFPSERSPLLTQTYPSPSPRAESLRLATELYNGHLEDLVSRQRAPNSSGGSTPAAITDASGATTPLSVSPSTPASAASSYFDLRQPPLYINDVQVALERETKRRNSNEFSRANVLAGFHMASSNTTSGTGTPTTTDGLTMMKRPSLMRRFSNQTSVSSGGKSKPFSEETAWLTSSLVCLLHSPDLSQFFLSGQYLDEDVDSKYHRAVIDAFAGTAQFFWPGQNLPQPAPALDLTVFQHILKRATPSATAAPTPLSSSPISRPASPPMLSSSPASSNATLVNPSASPSTQTGGETVSHLLRSLHVALNEGEYTSDQPTYLRSPYQLSAFDDEGLDEGLRRHAGFLRNMQNIQEDSIVRDVFEGLVCVKTACGGEGCEETTARFEGFSVLPLPAPPKREGNKKPSLGALLKAYEKPAVHEKPQWCRACAQYTQHTETKKVWSLPSTIIFQLPSTTPQTPASSPSAGPSSASSSRTNSPHMMARRLSRSHSVSLPGSPFGGLAGMTPLSTQVPVDYPLESLDLGKFNGEARSSPSTHRSLSSSSSSSLPYDLSSESGDDDELAGSQPALESDDEEDVYDLFAVREFVKENRYRVFAKDPVVQGQGKWAMFDAATGVSREVKDLREVVTPNADLLFYRRREEA